MGTLPVIGRMRERLQNREEASVRIAFDVKLGSARASGWNVFNFSAENVIADFLSDSGTGPLSRTQLELLKKGNSQENRAYGSRKSFYTLQYAVWETFGLQKSGSECHFFPFPQGRAAESVFFGCLKDALGKDADGVRVIIPSNSHFDTTRANIELCGFEAHDLPIDASVCSENDIFRGNMNVGRLRLLLRSYCQLGTDDDYDEWPYAIEVPVTLMTITNNTRGGLPVSMKNIRATVELCRQYEVPFFFDAARFAENAYFIKKYEDGYADRTIGEIVHEMFSYCDGFLISFKKDGLSHTGGGLVLKCNSLLLKRFPNLPDAIETRLIITMSNSTQGAIPGGYQLAIAEGLHTATTLPYLEKRISQVARFGKLLKDAGIPVLEPFGGHAVYVDVDRFFADTAMKRSDFGGISLTALLLLYGVRACELGAFAFGKYDAAKNEEIFPDFNLVRLAIPRRAYADRDLGHAVWALMTLHEMRHEIPRAVPVYGRDLPLRHMKARFELESVS